MNFNDNVNVTEGLNVTLSNDSLRNESSYKQAADHWDFYIVERLSLMIPVCTVGIVFNILNIIVLTRKRMRSSINILLTGLAVSDLTNIIFEIIVPIIIQNVTPSGVPLGYSTYGLGIFSLIDYYVAFWFTNVTNWTTVTVGMWRYIAVSSPFSAQIWCTSRRAKIAIATIIFISSLLASPEVILYAIRPVFGINTSTVQIYEMYFTTFAFKNNMANFNIYRYAYVIMRLTPSVIVVYVTFVLIKTLYQAASVRKRLSEKDGTKRSEGGVKRFDRTTAMMLVIVVFFLISNLPYSVLITLSLVGDSNVVNEIFGKVQDFFQLAIIVNYTINFLIYYLMSRKFRNTFLDVFFSVFPKINRRRHQTSSSDTVETCTDESLKTRNLRKQTNTSNVMHVIPTPTTKASSSNVKKVETENDLYI